MSKYTLQLRAMDDAEVTYYAVNVYCEGIKVETFGDLTENYNRAVVVAKGYFEDLRAMKADVEVEIDSPFPSFRAAIETSNNKFPDLHNLESLERDFYENLELEFLRIISAIRDVKQSYDVNTLFHYLVCKHKLNLHQERALLKHVEPIIEDDLERKALNPEN